MDSRDDKLLEALKDLSGDAKAPPDFVENVMRKAELSPPPRRTLIDTLGDWLWNPRPANMRMALATLLVILMVGAIPQYLTWFSTALGRRPNDASALLQAKLWEKNLACHNAMNAQGAAEGAAIAQSERAIATVLTCPSGDALVQISSKDGTTKRLVWVPFDTDAVSLSRILPSLVGTAFAEEAPHRLSDFQVAQAVRVLCSRRLPNGLIKRRVAFYRGGCVDEFIDPYTGRVVQTNPAPCTCTQF